MQVIIIAAVLTAADQAVKAVIQRSMFLHESIPVIPDFFHLTYIVNRGAAFGVLENQQWLFLLVAVILFLLYGVFYRNIPRSWLIHCGLGLLLGGALGNALDRALKGAVVDFFDFRVWPVFNVADMGIVIGVLLLLWYSWTHSSTK